MPICIKRVYEQFVPIVCICICTLILYLHSRAKNWVGVRGTSCGDLGPFAVTGDTLIHFPESQNPIDRLRDDVDGEGTLLSNGVTDYTYIRYVYTLIHFPESYSPSWW